MQTNQAKSLTDLPVVLSAPDVQTALGVSRKTAYDLMNAKGFPSFRLGAKGGRVLVPRDAFIQWLNRQTGMSDEA